MVPLAASVATIRRVVDGSVGSNQGASYRNSFVRASGCEIVVRDAVWNHPEYCPNGQCWIHTTTVPMDRLTRVTVFEGRADIWYCTGLSDLIRYHTWYSASNQIDRMRNCRNIYVGSNAAALELAAAMREAARTCSAPLDSDQ